MVPGIDLVEGGHLGLRSQLLVRLVEVDPELTRPAAVLGRRIVLVRRVGLDETGLGPDHRFRFGQPAEPPRQGGLRPGDRGLGEGQQLLPRVEPIRRIGVDPLPEGNGLLLPGRIGGQRIVGEAVVARKREAAEKGGFRKGRDLLSDVLVRETGHSARSRGGVLPGRRGLSRGRRHRPQKDQHGRYTRR